MTQDPWRSDGRPGHDLYTRMLARARAAAGDED